MSNEDGRRKVGRREALATIAGGVAVTASVAVAAKGGAGAERLPVVYLPHGGGPWPFADLGVPQHEREELTTYLRSGSWIPAAPPKALLVVSAHWEESVPTVMTAVRPPMLFDYYNFPEHTYRLSWPAPGAPAVAQRVRELLTAAGIESSEDPARGFDHGTFIPLMLTYPTAEVPALQLSLQRGLDPSTHLAIGRALAPLRDEGVLIVGSGMTYHNLRRFFARNGMEDAERFDAWLKRTTLAEPEARDAGLAKWQSAPSARAAHPREEHLLPLMVIAGAAGEDRGVLDYNGTYYGHRLSGYHFG